MLFDHEFDLDFLITCKRLLNDFLKDVVDVVKIRLLVLYKFTIKLY